MPINSLDTKFRLHETDQAISFISILYIIIYYYILLYYCIIVIILLYLYIYLFII